MKMLKVLLTISIICIASIGFAGDKFKPAPKPHYTKEKGYGWHDGIPHDKATNPFIIIKIWKTKDGFSVFTDMNKDGQCDTVVEFEYTGEFSSDGAPYVEQLADSNCIIKDIEIKRFIKENK